MPDRVCRGIKNLLSIRAPTIDVLRLSWFGGEPLLAKDIVLELSRHAFSLSRKYGFRLTGGVTTNGYFLTRDLAVKLIALKQDRFQISLDGWEDGHNQTRRMADGRPTFSTIWSNLLALTHLPGRFQVLLRLHLSRANAPSMEQLCAQIAKKFGDDVRFSVNFQDVRDLGGPGRETVVAQSERELAERVDHLTRVLTSRGPWVAGRVTNNLASAAASAGSHATDEVLRDGAYICYASKPNSVLIRSNGRLGKCTVVLDSPANNIGKILEDGTLVISNPKLRRWFHGLESMDPTALACPATALRKTEIALHDTAMVSRCTRA